MKETRNPGGGVGLQLTWAGVPIADKTLATSGDEASPTSIPMSMGTVGSERSRINGQSTVTLSSL